jgi:hypothetical protein
LFWSFFGAAALCAVPRENDSRKETPFGIYLFFSFAVLVVTVGSQGGARNYFLEYWAALLLWIACFTGRSLQTGRMSGWGFLLSAAIPAMILASVELATAKPRTYTHLTPKKMERSSRIVGELRKIVRLIGKDDPGILCLAWPNHVRTVTRKTIVSDPFLYSRLWNCGIVDVNAVIRDVADQKFDLVILSRDSLLGERRPRCPVDYLVRAVEYRYRVVGSGYFLYLAPRREGNPADAAKERIPA